MDTADPSSAVAAYLDAEHVADIAEDETDAADVADDDAAFVEALAEPVAADEWRRRSRDNPVRFDTSLLNYFVDNAAAVRPCAGRHHQSCRLASTDVTLPYFLSYLADYQSAVAAAAASSD